MAMQNDRAAIQVAALDLQKVNDAFRRVSQQITLLEGRSGTVGVRDSMVVTSDKQTLIDFDSSTAGKGAIVAFGTENATLALAKGSRKEDNGEWIATDTASTIFALDRAGNGTLYYDSGLTVGQAFNPTAIYVIGSGGSVGAHTLTGGSSPHTESGLTPGYILTATGATTFGWAAAPATGVPTTRNINTTLPLTGGGDLSADRTLSINEATIGTVGVSGLEGTIVPPGVGGSGEKYALVNNDGDGTPDVWAWITEGLGATSGKLKLAYTGLTTETAAPAADTMAFYDSTDSTHKKGTIDAIMATVDAATLGAGASTDGQLLTSDGAGGAAWEDAASTGSALGNILLHVNTTPVGNVGAGEDDLITYTLPGGTLATNGDSLLCTFAGTTAANTNAKTGKLYFGASSSSLLSTSSAGVTYWKMQMLVVRTGAATQRVVMWGGNNGADIYNQYFDATETLSGNITIKATGTGVSNDDVIAKFLTVEYLPYGVTTTVPMTIAGRAFPAQADTGIGTWPADHAYFNKLVRRYETTAALTGGANLTGAGSGTTTPTHGYETDHHAHTSLTTSSTINTAASVRNATPEWDMADLCAGWFFTVRFGVVSRATVWKTDGRVFIGLNASSAAMAGATDPSGLVNIVGLGKDTADGVFYFMHNDGAGAATKTTAVLTNNPTADVWYDFSMWMPPDGASVGWELIRTSTRATIASGTATTNLPATGALYSPHVFLGNGSGVSANRIDMAFMHIEAYY